MKKIYLLVIVLLIIATSKTSAQQEELQLALTTMAKENRPAKVSKMFKEIVQKFQLDPINDQETFDMLHGTSAISYIVKGKNKQFEQHIEQIKSKFNTTSYLNMAVDMLSNDAKKLQLAKNLAERTLKLYYAYHDDLNARPASFPAAQWAKFMEMAKYPYHETYAKVLYLLNMHKEALAQQEIALSNQNLEDLGQSSAALYANILVANERQEEAYEVLKTMAALDRATDQMIVELRRLHESIKGYGVDRMLDEIKQNLRKTYQQKMIKKIIRDTDAPPFTLQNLEGISKSLSDYHGKVIVIDFWATWCVPCIQSMPAMDQMRKANPDVAFLFIATQEKPIGALERVKKFIETNQYKFEVLLDLANAEGKYVTLTDYKISGLPSKVVIDAEGNLLFSSLGFTNQSNLVNELQAMIDIAKNPPQNN